MYFKNLANAIRFLSFDMVEKAGSGHPGLPSGMADVMAVLWTKFLKFHAPDPLWSDRDRFILSAGHGSAMLYSLFYLLGYPDIDIDDLKSFRKLHSKTAGHPEYGLLLGIETTTGPLGQGLATAVGMAVARDLKKMTHKICVLVSDGDLMEGISHEACSFAGHHQFKDFIVIHDNNHITIDGPLSLASSDHTIKRFESYGFKTLSLDGHDFEDIEFKLNEAYQLDCPVFLSCHTKIGFGTSKENTAASHGSPLGTVTLERARIDLQWPYKSFEIPDIILDKWRECGKRFSDVYHKSSPVKPQIGLYKRALQKFKNECIHVHPHSTREWFGQTLEVVGPHISSLIGGSSDLTPSNNTKCSHSVSFPQGHYIHYGIREHAMGAIMNGMSLHGGLIPYGGTFLVFSDYLKPSLRLSALMKQGVIYVFTHDSIGLGEDGPTHQPVEHLTALRAIPNLLVMRPCDGIEVAECLEIAIEERHQPTALILSRQKTPVIRKNCLLNLSKFGGYILDERPDVDLTLIATGTEIAVAKDVQKHLEIFGIHANISSIPCFELFNEQPQDYQCKVLGSGFRVFIEAGSDMCWYQYLCGARGMIVCVKEFGLSAPYEDLQKHFGMVAVNIVEMILKKYTKSSE
jgi:transketolase